MKKILIVDDEQNVRQLLSKVLKKEGFETYTACNGQEGLELLQTTGIDIIISDIRMPGMDGIEFLHRVKAVDHGIGFILITAFATTETAIDALKSGAQDYVTKPFDISEIVAAVRKLVIAGNDSNHYIGEMEDADGVKTKSKSPKMREVLELAKRVAAADSTVLIMGETGTGKEVVATAIHNWSSRRKNPLIKVNCGAIPDNLLESELFGYERGAFTGAVNEKPGRFEIADKGTIFLDEIGDISPSLQVKLLRVLQEKTFERLGGIASLTSDVRVIAATNKDLRKAVETGAFREDLYYRLNVVPINLPPLRERTEDIEDLIENFLRKSANISGSREPKTMSAEAMECLKKYSWPGNIRELENIVERCVVITAGTVIDTDSLPSEIVAQGSLGESAGLTDHDTKLNEAIDNKEREVIIRALEDNGGNKTKAALELGISRRSLHRKIQKYGIDM